MIIRKTRLGLKKRNALLKEFVRHHTAVDAAEELNINRNTANRWFNHFRQSIFQQYEKAPRFSGEVEIDEKLFGKGIKRRTYENKTNNYGAPYDREYLKILRRKKLGKRKTPPKNILVFGILRREGGVYTKIIEKRDRETLLPIIHLVVVPKTKIFSDRYVAYDVLKEEQYEHIQIDHSRGPTDRKKNHIGSIESFWSSCESHFQRFRGIARHSFNLHMKECEFRWNHRGIETRQLCNILKKIVF